MEAVVPAALYAREQQMHQTRSLLLSQNYHAKISLTNQCNEEMFWWTRQLIQWNGKQILTQNPYLVKETDASMQGWGYHCPALMQGRGGVKCNAQERHHHINALELKAAEIALLSLVKNKSKIHVHLKIDNTTAVSYVNKMGRGGGRSKIGNFVLEGRSLLLQSTFQSRKVIETSSNNWRLNNQVFSQINKQLGPIKLDLFAERLNAQVKDYVSWKTDPMAVATDAFMIKWTDRQAYAFPPFCLIPRCLAKVVKEGES